MVAREFAPNTQPNGLPMLSVDEEDRVSMIGEWIPIYVLSSEQRSPFAQIMRCIPPISDCSVCHQMKKTPERAPSKTLRQPHHMAHCGDYSRTNPKLNELGGFAFGS